jgi:hypothetical protein
MARQAAPTWPNTPDKVSEPNGQRPKLLGQTATGLAGRHSPHESIAVLQTLPHQRRGPVQQLDYLFKRCAAGFRLPENFTTTIYFHCGGLSLYP